MSIIFTVVIGIYKIWNNQLLTNAYTNMVLTNYYGKINMHIQIADTLEDF